MAVNASIDFLPDIGEIVEEAYERAGLEMQSGYDLRTARRSLDLMMLEWQNRGINLWTVEQQDLGLLTDVRETPCLALDDWDHIQRLLLAASPDA